MPGKRPSARARGGKAGRMRTLSGLGWPLPPGAGTQCLLLYTPRGGGSSVPDHESAFTVGNCSLLSLCTRDCVFSLGLWKARTCDFMSPAGKAAVGRNLAFRLPVLARRALA